MTSLAPTTARSRSRSNSSCDNHCSPQPLDTKMGAHRAMRQAPVLVFIEPLLFPIGQSQQLPLAGTNLKNLLDSVDKDLAIATVETGA